jgi:PAS domain S-box-containing protein
VWRADARTFETTFVTGEATDVLGYGMDAWTNEPRFWVDHLHPDDRERVLAYSSEAVREGRTHDFEYRMIAADGRTIWLRNIVTVVMENGVPVELIGVTTNVDERKRAEQEAAELRQELSRVTRAAALGELSTYLAHELNQPLGAITSNAEAAVLQIRQGRHDVPALTAILDDIRRDGERAGAVIRSLRGLLRRGPGPRAPVNAGLLVERVVELLRPILGGRGIEVAIEIPPDLPQVYGDAVQLQQVLMNLVMNASEAMATSALAHRRLRLSACVRDGLVEIAVADTGPGIGAQMLSRLFEPFVTSKPDGTGVGLAMCRRIVEAHGGSIAGQNNPSGGATFRFTVTRAESRAETAA